MTKTFFLQPDGSVSVSKEERETLMSASRHAEICAKMEDPNASLDKVLRLIHAEVVTVLRKIKECGSDPFQTKKLKQYSLEIDTLFAAGNAYKKRKLAEERDRLNFDGPAFQFAYNAIIELMEQATQEALGKNSAALIQRINTRFRDLVKKNEPKLRRDLQEMDFRTGTKASDARQSGKG